MARSIKIYTKTGDSGSTSLFGGMRVDKSSARIRAYGEVDELNSLLGIVLSEVDALPIKKLLLRIQGELFVLGADLATPLDVKIKIPRVRKSFITRLEKEIDNMSEQLPQLKNFILPGGGHIGAKLHLARTVARRAERSIADLARQDRINKSALIYINRLSDWLFILARYTNKLEKASEIVWRGRG